MMHAMFLQETSRFQLYRFTETVNSELTEGISQKEVQLGTLYRLMTKPVFMLQCSPAKLLPS